MIFFEYIKSSLFQDYLPNWITFHNSPMPNASFINFSILIFVVLVSLAILVLLYILQIRYNIMYPFYLILRTIFSLGSYIMKDYIPEEIKAKSASFLTKKEIRKYFKPDLKKELFSIDGANRRVFLSEDKLEGATIIFGKTGSGKSSILVKSNLLSLNNCSIIVSDISGELTRDTASSLARRGFDVKVINLIEPNKSMFFNPLHFLEGRLEIMEFSKNVVVAGFGNSSSSDPYWFEGASGLLTFLISLLLKTDKKYHNLSNVLHLLNNFHTKNFVKFLAKYGDSILISNYKSIISGNEKVLATFKQIINTSLSYLIVPELAYIISKNEIDFQEMRRKPTVLFIQTPASSHLNSLVNTVFSTFFKEMMKEHPKPDDLSIYAILDEFPALRIQNYPNISFVIRKYRVYMITLCQSIDQLEVNYSKPIAHSILNGSFANQVYMGCNLHTAQYLQNIIGKTIDKKSKMVSPLLYAHDISQLKKDQLLFFADGLSPCIINTLPAYKHPKMMKDMENKYDVQNRFDTPESVELYPFEIFENVEVA